MNKDTLFCPVCGDMKPAIPHVFGRCVWCATKDNLINSDQLADFERQGWAAGLPTLPHTFRQDAIDK